MARNRIGLFVLGSMALACSMALATPRRSPIDLPTYVCRRTASAVKVDGVLNEPAWRKASEATFFKWDGTANAVQPTTAKLCWDDKNLYIAFWCKDTDIYGTLIKRDELVWREEAVEVFLNPSADLRRYFEIEVSPRNVIFDLNIVYSPETNGLVVQDPEWNAPGMKTAVKMEGTLNQHEDSDKGWTVEISIPFALMKGAPSLPPKDGDRWRMGMFRAEAYPVAEYDCWSPIPGEIAAFHTPSRFGALVFKN